MRLTPAQIGVLLISGKQLPPFGEGLVGANSLPERIKKGHEWLVELTGKDFGYDLAAWHDHLKESREGGYTYGRNIVLPKIMKAALESPEWRAAVEELEADAARNQRPASGGGRL